jgi:hypothetical protein
MEHNFKEELRGSFEFDKIFDFCQNNIVTVERYPDSKYHCHINRKEWDTAKGISDNPFVALVLGVNNYIENNK